MGTEDYRFTIQCAFDNLTDHQTAAIATSKVPPSFSIQSHSAFSHSTHNTIIINLYFPALSPNKPPVNGETFWTPSFHLVVVNIIKNRKKIKLFLETLEETAFASIAYMAPLTIMPPQKMIRVVHRLTVHFIVRELCID